MSRIIRANPDPPLLALQDAEQCDSQLLDRAAVRRALDYYLHDHKPARPISTAIFAIPDSVNSEAALAQASDLLRCAVASASEAGDGLCGPARDRVLSVMHLVELDAACKRAEEVILDQRVFVLEGADFDAFA
ncbi:DUF3077 domain-containing protein [Pseudomonas bubulae]|nr:DUF3077 domain-containing protein [Pseudomonas bubulae]